jgi:hypothetical protein
LSPSLAPNATVQQCKSQQHLNVNAHAHAHAHAHVTVNVDIYDFFQALFGSWILL